MPRRRHTSSPAWGRRIGAPFFGLCVLAMFCVPVASVAGGPPKRLQRAQAVPAPDIFSVLGLAIKDERLRLRQARAACDRHAARSTRGNVNAMLGLGQCFMIGIGRPKRLLRAKAMFEAAAARGSAEAHLALGRFYLDGAIVRKNFRRAADHFRRAARAGLAEAMVEYGLVLRRAEADPQAACRWFERSARANARNGIRLLGDCFAYEIGGRLNRAYASELYRKAAGLGDGTARLKLAGHPFLGTGSDIARWEGCEWASRSAARNNISAMRAAAYCASVLR